MSSASTTFQQQVTAALRPGGRVFLVDSYHHERLPDDRQQRVLSNGRRFEVVKRSWQPDELEAIPDWRLTARVSANQHIIYAAGRSDAGHTYGRSSGSPGKSAR